MKRLIYLFAIFPLVIIGCSNDKIVSADPMSEPPTYKLIQLPMAEGMRLNSFYSDSKNIDGSVGGTLTLQGSYNGGPFGTITVSSKLEFPAGAFSGSKTISMTADDQYCASTFLPGISFSKSGIYNVTYTGIDLTGINPATVRFVYLKNDGNLEYPLHEGIIVDFSIGKISVKNAHLNHFSRYGFVN